MSHIVIHEDTNNVTQYAPFDDVQSAAAYLEELHNADGPTNARLFALEEVHFAVRSYVKVEIDDVAPAPISDVEPSAVFTDAPADTAVEAAEPVAETPQTSEDDADEEVDTVEYVEAAMAPVDTYAQVPVTDLDDAAPGEVRRGLFGR